jgi:DNA (cytosine-5)-methyltransferase 1
MSARPILSAVGLFAGIGGVEKGLSDAGIEAGLLCEWWEPAQRVLRARWPGVGLVGDVRDLKSLPKTDVISAGFPCTDLSQAGRMAGISGHASGLVGEVFRLLATVTPTWLILENVRNMLVLDGGRAMHYLVNELESRGYRWAYRLVDSRSSGVAQRRQRVLLVASQTEDPRGVLFSDDAGDPGDKYLTTDVYGFYWTEGFTGLGWAQDALPTLKGGSTIGIPSPPAFWHPEGTHGRRLLTPRIEDAEALQGFPRGWTRPAVDDSKVNGPRWKLVGNAVTVGMAKWLGGRLVNPGDGTVCEGHPLKAGDKWPTAAWGESGKAWRADVSLWPIRRPYRHLTTTVNVDKAKPVSARGAAGFLSRMNRSSLRFDPHFRADVEGHVRHMQDQLST